MKYVEIRRHTDNDGDQLTPAGVAAAEEIGKTGTHPPYAVFVSTGAARANQMLEIVRAAVGQDDVPVLAETGLRSAVEGRWREAAKAASASDIESIRRVDPDLVEKETHLLGTALLGVFARLPDGGRALVVGHSPTNEAAVLGLTRQSVPPLGKGEGVLVIEEDGRYAVEPLSPSTR